MATFVLPIDGDVRFARWQHPGETPKVVTQQSVDALRTFLREGDVAIDIGADTGDSTLPSRGGRRARSVFALQPNPSVFKVLAANAALIPRRRAFRRHVAATPADG